MIYKNDPNKLKLAVNKYRIKMFCIYAFAIIFNFVLFYFFLPKLDPNFEGIRHIYPIMFSLLAIFCVFIVFIASKKLKKNFSEYSFEFTDENSMVITNGGSVKTYNLTEIKKIECISENKFIIYMNDRTRFYTSEFLENQEDFNNELAQHAEIHKSSTFTIFRVLSWIFCIGFILSRFFGNIWIYTFFAVGFIITSIITVYQCIFSTSKLWAKIYMAFFYLIFDSLIIYGLFISFRAR